MKLKLCFIFALLLINGNFVSILSQQTNSNEALYLTPLIRNGQYAEAQRLSSVEPFDGFNYTSFSGYITIAEVLNSNVFFWYFLAQNDSANAPVVLWMAGGPGLSSLMSLFGETGPFYPDQNLTLRPREYNWMTKFNVLYIDSPIGTGFSFTNSSIGYATTENDVTLQVYAFLQQFFTLFPEYSRNKFYIAAESFAGKFGVNLIRTIFEQPTTNIDLQSIFKGYICVSGFLDPSAMIRSSGHLYHIGLLNERERDYLSAQESIGLQYLNDGFTAQATRLLTNLMLDQNSVNDTSLFRNFTGMTQFSDYLITNTPPVYDDYQRFVVQDYVRQRIHVGNNPFNNNSEVTRYLYNVLMQNDRNLLESVLNNNHRVLLLSGQTDILINPFVQRQFVSNLNWVGSAQYEQADRIVWRVEPNDEEIAGYVTQALNLVEIMVRNAGHMIPSDQPRAVLDAVLKFMYMQSFD